MVLAGLRAALADERDLEIVGEAADGERALAAIRALRPDLALLDAELPGLSGAALARELLGDAGCRTALVLLSLRSGEQDLAAALDAGASGYLLKGSELATELLPGLRTALRGELAISSRLAEVLDRIQRRRPSC